MTVGRAAALLVVLVGVLFLGIVIGAHFPEKFGNRPAESAISTEPQPAQPAAEQPTAPKKKASAAAVAAKRAEAAESTAVNSRIPADTPELQKRLKAVLNKGTDLDKAAEGFRDAEQFATVAHASKNTDVPFMVLKHRVLNEGMPLSTAIHESNPYLDVSAAAQLARAEARKDLAALDE